MSYPAYPDYKDSGVEWLGKVPAHWEVKPLKRAIASVESGTSVNAADVPAVRGEKGVLKTSCVYRGWFDWRENKTVNKEDLGRVSCPLRKNTLIVSRMNTPELVGAAGLVAEAPAGIFLPDRLWQVSMKGRCSPKYYYYFTRSPAYRDQVKIVCAGTSSSMQNLGQDEFGAIWHPSPPLHEQQIIAAFLDHETARIDALVEEQQCLIALLKEKRQAVISHAVTKGLDPDVPMKDSGVKWLGEVPEHWRILRLKHMIRTTGGSTPSKEIEDYWNGGIPWVSPKDMKRHRISDSIDHISEKAINETGLSLVKAGSVLIVVRGMILAHSVPVAITEAGVTINQDMKALEAGPELAPEYLLLLLSGIKDSIFEYIDSSAHGTRKLEWERFEAIQLPVPPINEQKFLVSTIVRLAEEIDGLSVDAEGLTKLLRERRSALISAAVTGKIDVRGWQPPAGSSTSSETTQMEAI